MMTKNFPPPKKKKNFPQVHVRQQTQEGNPEHQAG